MALIIIAYYSDLLQTFKGDHLSALGFEQKGPLRYFSAGVPDHTQYERSVCVIKQSNVFIKHVGLICHAVLLFQMITSCRHLTESYPPLRQL